MVSPNTSCRGVQAEAEALSAKRREEVEEALRTAERQMQQLVHSVKAIVWRMDAASGRFTFVSQAAEQLLGYPVRRWTDDARFFPAMLHADDRGWVARYSRRATQEGRDHTREYRVFSQDGRLVWLRASQHPRACGSLAGGPTVPAPSRSWPTSRAA